MATKNGNHSSKFYQPQYRISCSVGTIFIRILTINCLLWVRQIRKFVSRETCQGFGKKAMTLLKIFIKSLRPCWIGVWSAKTQIWFFWWSSLTMKLRWRKNYHTIFWATTRPMLEILTISSTFFIIITSIRHKYSRLNMRNKGNDF